MLRILAFVVTLMSLALTAPAHAQSFGLASTPVVFVTTPVVQPLHPAQRLSATPVIVPAAVLPNPEPAAPATQSAQQMPPRATSAFATPHTRPATPSAWRAPVIDRAFRDYRRGVAQYGPFLVLDAQRAALVGETDERTPGAFRAMLRAYPQIAQLDMVECPGTRDDRANMQLGRMIRAAQIVTHVPAIGSVRSGAVELFLAGVERDIADGAEFAVHSWMDEYGRQPDDFADDAPENRQYIDYYREMGMADTQARAFYAMTNSVPHRSARWLDAGDMRSWLAPRPMLAARTRPTNRSALLRKALGPKFAYASIARF